MALRSKTQSHQKSIHYNQCPERSDEVILNEVKDLKAGILRFAQNDACPERNDVIRADLIQLFESSSDSPIRTITIDSSHEFLGLHPERSEELACPERSDEVILNEVKDLKAGILRFAQNDACPERNDVIRADLIQSFESSSDSRSAP